MQRIRNSFVPYSLVALFSLWLALVVSLPAQAGTYTVTYSGGQVVVTNSSGTPTTTPYALTNGGWGGSGTGYWTSTSGSAVCQNQITATFTWQAATPDDVPPDTVIVAADSVATYSLTGSAVTQTCSDGQGDPQVVVNGSGNSNGWSYQVVQNPGTSFSVSCTPSVNVAGSGYPSYGYATVYVSYNATAFPTVINLNGTEYQNNQQNILIGQGCSATLSTSAPNASLKNYQWNVSGDTFKSYEAHGGTNGFAKVTFLTSPDLSQASPHWYWRSESTATVKGSADVYVNNIKIGTATAQQPVTVWKPTYSFASTPGNTQIWKDPYQGNQVWLEAADPGISWTGSATPPSVFHGIAGQGLWSIVQIESPNRSYSTNDGVTHVWSINNLVGLDDSYPYAPYTKGVINNDDNLGFKDNNLPSTSSDSPGMFLPDGYNSVSINESFSTYMMYRPADVGQGHNWVPLHRVTWTWGADALRPGNSWLNEPLPYIFSPVHKGFDDRCKTHPEWNRVLFATAPYVP